MRLARSGLAVRLHLWVRLRLGFLAARLDRQVLDPSWDVHEVALEDIVLAYMGEDAAPSNGMLTPIGEAS